MQSEAGAHHGRGPQAELPFIDAHTIEVDAPCERVWDVLVLRVLPRFGGGTGRLGSGCLGRAVARLLHAPYPEGAEQRIAGIPATVVGFRVGSAERPSLVELVGEHRFASYVLTLRAEELGRSRTRLSATTHAAFHGPSGRVYRAVVIGSGGHVRVVMRLLGRVKRLAQSAPARS